MFRNSDDCLQLYRWILDRVGLTCACAWPVKSVHMDIAYKTYCVGQEQSTAEESQSERSWLGNQAV